MSTRTVFWSAAVLGLVGLVGLGVLSQPATAQDQPAPTASKPADAMLFDFEKDEDLKAWAPLDLPDAKVKEPAAKVELSAEGATSGSKCLKITFDGGNWPAITTTKITVPGDWQAYQTLKADVTVPRQCLVGFRVLQEKSKRDPGWDGDISRWEKTCLLPKGKTSIIAALHDRNKYAIDPRWGGITTFEIYMYHPQKGESILADNIRLSADSVPPGPSVPFTVLGTDEKVGSVGELAKKMKDKWAKPEDKKLEQVEKDFQTKFEELKKTHPKAVCVTFRQGQKGFDPANPDKAYEDWSDTHINSHGPDGATLAISFNAGKWEMLETFMRHRSQLIRIDTSSLPKGADILAAQFVMIRAMAVKPGEGPADRPTMWVAEACNRPWVQTEANGYEYAKDKFWKSTGGMSGESHAGDDPDFWPVFLAYGPSQGAVNTWDFTQAVKFWTDGKHENHGFFFHTDGSDFFQAFSSKARKVETRPELMVIYEPK